MTNAMKNIIVSGSQAQIDNKTFVERIAYLLADDLMEFLCNGIPKEILSYDNDNMKDIIEDNCHDNGIEIRNVELTNDPYRPVRVTYTATTVRYFISQEDAQKAKKDGNRCAGNDTATESHPFGCAISYRRKTSLSICESQKCCTFKMI